MKKRQGNNILWVGLVGTLIIGGMFFTDVYQAFWGNRNIWWTHQDMKLNIEQTRDSFELYIGGQLMQKRIAEGTLFSLDKNGKQYPVVAGDITVRLNNWHKVKSTALANATVSGFALGVVVTLLVTGLLIQIYSRENKT